MCFQHVWLVDLEAWGLFGKLKFAAACVKCKAQEYEYA